MGPLDPETDTVQRQFTVLADPSEGLHVTPGRATQSHTQRRLGGGGSLGKRLYPGFHGDKWAMHSRQVQLESPQWTLRAVPCRWWRSEQTAQSV